MERHESRVPDAGSRERAVIPSPALSLEIGKMDRPSAQFDDRLDGGDDADPIDPILAAARARGFRTFRALGTVMALASTAVLLPGILENLPLRGLSFAVVLAIAFTLASWFIPARRHRFAAAFTIGAVGLIAVLGVWVIGPSFTMGSLFVLVPLLATFFFGRRMAVPAATVAALALAAIGVAAWALGRPEVGTLPGAAVPHAVFAHLAVTTLGSTAIALAVVHATMTAVDRAIHRARDAAAHERQAHAQRISAERALARAKELEAIGQLANGVADDTRNALAVLAAGVQELRASSEDRAQILDDIEHAVAGVKSTMEQLQFLGRRQASIARPLPLEAELHHFASALRRVIPPEVELHVECHSQAQAVLDPVQLEQALLQLALNARDSMPEGGLLTLRLHDESRGGRRWAMLEVEDSGVGMEPAAAARLFEASIPGRPARSGHWRGLHMVQDFVGQADGEIEVESDVGQGTLVRLRFPMVGLVGM